mmetsp:Transcript_3608/g.4724  ORF Transcript_3608/g.4724 Transcript_3608/m.4724 type:complete len:228 (-) Transcript_3608:685-1368(-)
MRKKKRFKKRKFCKYHRRGYCRYGSHCRYRHGKINKECRYHKSNSCAYGKRCWYKHTKSICCDSHGTELKEKQVGNAPTSAHSFANECTVNLPERTAMGKNKQLTSQSLEKLEQHICSLNNRVHKLTNELQEKWERAFQLINFLAVKLEGVNERKERVVSLHTSIQTEDISFDSCSTQTASKSVHKTTQINLFKPLKSPGYRTEFQPLKDKRGNVIGLYEGPRDYFY